MGVLPPSTGRWHHQFGAARVLPRQLPGRRRVRDVWIKRCSTHNWCKLNLWRNGTKYFIIPTNWNAVLPQVGFTGPSQAGDQRWMRTVSSSLHLLHSLYGPFSKVYGIGRFSKVPSVHLLGKHHFIPPVVLLFLTWTAPFRWSASVGGSRWKRESRRAKRRKSERFFSSTGVGCGPLFYFIFEPRAEANFILSDVSSQMWTMSLLCAHKWSTKDS